MGVTGASAQQLAVRALQLLLDAGQQVELVASRGCAQVWRDEQGLVLPRCPDAQEAFWRRQCGRQGGQLRCHPWNALGAAIASGSYPVRGMVILPCTMGTVARLAAGVSLELLERAADVSRVHYGFFLGACGDGANLPVLEQDAQGPLARACGIKMFMGTGHGVLECSDPGVQEAVFARGSKLVAVHAEDQQRIRQRREQLLATDPRPADLHSTIQDPEAALLATRHALRLSRRFQRRLHVLHLSTGMEAELLRREKTALVSTEVTPQHLLLNRSAYGRLGALAQMNPPLRDEEDNRVLWKALVDGVIDCIATDHAPHTLEEKARPYPRCPSGMPGVETSLPLMLTQARAGRCSLADVSRWMSRRPAELYGLEGKGRLAVGYHGDLTVVDLHTTRPVRNGEMVSKCGWSPFDGWELVGWPVATVVAGVVGYAQGVFHEGCRGSALQFS